MSNTPNWLVDVQQFDSPATADAIAEAEAQGAALAAIADGMAYDAN